jgi:hypothetical protein
MSQRLRRFAPLLNSLFKASAINRKAFLKKHCNEDFINCIAECVHNILKGNVKLSAPQKSKLSRRKKLMRKLILRKTSSKNKKKIIQSGGFLGAILGPIVKVLGGLFAGGS